MGIQPTASATELLLSCQRPFDPSIEVPPRESGRAARYGSAFHEAMAARCSERTFDAGAILRHHDVRVAEADFTRHVDESKRYLDKWIAGDNPWDLRWEVEGVERSYAYNPRKDLPRDAAPPDEETHTYPDLQPGEVGLTVDLELRAVKPREGVELAVFDFKSGWVSKHASAAEVPQLQTIGAALRANIVAAMETHKDAIPAIYAERLFADDVERHRKALTRALRRVGDGSMRPSAPVCKYCPSRDSCPAVDFDLVSDATAIVAAMGGVVQLHTVDDRLATADEVGRLHQLFATYDRVRERGRTLIRQFVQDHPELVVIRPDGGPLEMREKTVESLSKASIVRAFGKVEAERRIAELREAGAVEIRTRVELHVGKE